MPGKICVLWVMFPVFVSIDDQPGEVTRGQRDTLVSRKPQDPGGQNKMLGDLLHCNFSIIRKTSKNN